MKNSPPAICKSDLKKKIKPECLNMDKNIAIRPQVQEVPEVYDLSWERERKKAEWATEALSDGHRVCSTRISWKLVIISSTDSPQLYHCRLFILFSQERKMEEWAVA